jgi:hypothetical protein
MYVDGHLHALASFVSNEWAHTIQWVGGSATLDGTVKSQILLTLPEIEF